MCGGPSVPPDNSATIAAQQQAAKEANVAQGENAISKIFGGTVPADQPADTSVVTFAHPTASVKSAGTYYESNAPVPGGSFPYAIYDGSGNVVGYSGDKATESGSTQSPGGTINGPTTTLPGQFNDAYYNQIGQNYEDYYNPQLDTQYQNSLNALTLQLGQQGILNSSEGDRQIALLNQNDQTQKDTIANNALSQEQTARQTVAQERNSLLAQNQTAADPSLAAESAAAGAQSVQSTPTFSPLGSVFAGLLGTGTNALSIQQGGLAGTNAPSSTFINPGSNVAGIGPGNNAGSSTGKVVG